MASLSEIAPAFVEMAHRIVWCTVASVDASNRPRSRVLHPLWVWQDEVLTGWICTGATPAKQAHLTHSASGGRVGPERCSGRAGLCANEGWGLISELQLRPGRRERNGCDYLDFYVDGQRLADLLEIGDYISPFGWLKPEEEARFAGLLLGKMPADLPGGRVPLFICPECAQYDCGVYSCRLDRRGKLLHWLELGMEPEIDEHTFSFDVTAYYHTLAKFR